LYEKNIVNKKVQQASKSIYMNKRRRTPPSQLLQPQLLSVVALIVLCTILAPTEAKYYEVQAFNVDIYTNNNELSSSYPCNTVFKEEYFIEYFEEPFANFRRYIA